MVKLSHIRALSAIRAARNGDISLLIGVLRDESTSITMLERNLIADLLDGTERRSRGRPREKYIQYRIQRVVSYVLWLKYVEGWKEDAARQRAAEVFSISRATVDSYDRRATEAFEWDTTQRNVVEELTEVELEKLNIYGSLSPFVSIIQNIMAGKSGYTKEEWEDMFVPPSTTDK